MDRDSITSNSHSKNKMGIHLDRVGHQVGHEIDLKIKFKSLMNCEQLGLTFEQTLVLVWLQILLQSHNILHTLKTRRRES